MDAVRTAQMLSLDGLARRSPAVGHIAVAILALVWTFSQRLAQRVPQASTKFKPTIVIARIVARVSTGPLQDQSLKHPARHVPRTRTRMLRAVLVLPALATRATVATPGQGIAQRA